MADGPGHERGVRCEKQGVERDVEAGLCNAEARKAGIVEAIMVQALDCVEYPVPIRAPSFPPLVCFPGVAERESIRPPAGPYSGTFPGAGGGLSGPGIARNIGNDDEQVHACRPVP